MSPAEARAALAGPGRVALIRQAAEVGVAEAQAVYGQMLLDGREIAADARAGFGWFLRAAAQEHLMALNMVGRCYELGWGVAPDPARAAACYRVAAERGMAEAMYNYATQLALGRGVAEDKPAAFAWLRRAAAQGFAKRRISSAASTKTVGRRRSTIARRRNAMRGRRTAATFAAASTTPACWWQKAGCARRCRGSPRLPRSAMHGFASRCAAGWRDRPTPSCGCAA